MLSLIFISGLIATVSSARLILLGSALALFILFVGLVDATYPTARLYVLDDATALPLMGVMIALVGRQVLREGPITVHRIRGAMALYLLIGLLWAMAYDLVETLSPGSFKIGSSTPGNSLGTLGYYSFTTLTTLGPGDVFPITHIARSLTVLEALVGQLFPAVLIARLVSMEVSYRQSHTGVED